MICNKIESSRKGKTVLIRVDASKDIGFGHLIRCFCLGEEILRRKHSVLFVTRRYDGLSERLLKRKGFNYETLNNNLTKKQEIERINSIAVKHKTSVMVFDTYSLTNNYILKIKKQGIPICLIDDRNYLVRPDVEAITNGNGFAKQLEYVLQKKTKLYLGEKFFLLDKCFIASKKEVERGRKKAAGVCMSNMDYDSLQRVVGFLNSFIDEEIDVVFTGAQKDYMAQMKKIYRGHQNISIYHDLDTEDIARLMKGCCLFFLSGGTMMYQAIAAGCIVFAMPVHKHQRRNVNALVRKKVVRSLEKDQKLLLAQKKKSIEKIIKDPGQRKRILETTAGFVDGKGPQRVADIVLSLC